MELTGLVQNAQGPQWVWLTWAVGGHISTCWYGGWGPDGRLLVWQPGFAGCEGAHGNIG